MELPAPLLRSLFLPDEPNQAVALYDCPSTDITHRITSHPFSDTVPQSLPPRMTYSDFQATFPNRLPLTVLSIRRYPTVQPPAGSDRMGVLCRGEPRCGQ